jgi:tetratricopeptide (TPR) repeat protein
MNPTLTRPTTMPENTASEQKFVPRLLPWIVAVGFLVVYLLTLNHWLALRVNAQQPFSTSSLLEVARVSGWTWQADLDEPLYWLVTYPFRLLPQTLIPVALNLFSAVCAVLVLANLARSVAILPHDRTEEQRSRERSPFSLLSIPTSWVPPVFAAIVCGLQLSFWEHATAASGEMLNLLLFSYVIRCLLEYRLDANQSWLSRGAFIFSASMANSWGMVGFFPAFLAAVIWVKGLSFFNVRFLTRMAVWGFAGLLFYLLLPLVSSLSSGVEVGFWQALRFNLTTQKALVVSLPFSKFQVFNPERPLWILLLPSFLPVVIMGIRWPSYFGDPSRLGVGIATLTFHFFHAVLLGVCLYFALDPQFSPRNLVGGTPMLSFYYLGALSAGYLCGYFLLIFGAKPLSRMRPGLPSIPLVNAAVLALLWAAMVIVPTILIYRNLSQVSITNGPMLEEYAAFSENQLPKAPTVVLSDDPRRLFVMRSALAREGRDKRYIFVDTASMEWPDYHRFMKKKYPQWPADPPKGFVQKIEDPGLFIQILAKLAQSNQVYYLHPSFGYYFEAFYAEPKGTVYQLQSYPTNALFAPPPSSALFAQNEEIWAMAETNIFQYLTNAISTGPAEGTQPGPERFLQALHLKRQTNYDAATLGAFYSRSLTFWGVALQREGKLAEAAVEFERARKLNPQNLIAQINLECNQRLQKGEHPSVLGSQSMEERFGSYRNWDQIMNDNGPFDEPNFCFEGGRTSLRTGAHRQAAEQFNRVLSFLENRDKLSADDAAKSLLCHLWLAHINVLGRDSDAALKLIADIHAREKVLGVTRTNAPDLLAVETSASLAKKDVAGAESVVSKALEKYPADETLLATATQVYMQYGYYSNALQTLDQSLRISPGEPTTLVNKGFAYIQLGNYAQAVAPLTKAIELELKKEPPQTNNATGDQHSPLFYTAILNRGIANLRSEQFDAAQKDYETLQKAAPTEFRVHYGLGEIAYRKRDTNAAVRSYDLYMANAPTNTAEAIEIQRRLKELRPGV